jgi:hypothetical protein
LATPDPILLAELGALGRADRIAAVRRLSGGAISDTWLITYDDGPCLVTTPSMTSPTW